LSVFLPALSPLLEPALIPVVELDFILLVFVLPDFILECVVLVAPGPTLPSLDAPGAGCICADAIAVAPNTMAATSAEIASLDRMRILLLWMRDAGIETCCAYLGSKVGPVFRAHRRNPAAGARIDRVW
jgi:hypothetical protein